MCQEKHSANFVSIYRFEVLLKMKDIDQQNLQPTFHNIYSWKFAKSSKLYSEVYARYKTQLNL